MGERVQRDLAAIAELLFRLRTSPDLRQVSPALALHPGAAHGGGP